MTISTQTKPARRKTTSIWQLPALALLLVVSFSFSSTPQTVEALIPFLDGGKDIPKLYNGYFDSQIAKQAATAVGAAISSGKTNIEVNLPAVPNVEEVRFGCVMLCLVSFFHCIVLCFSSMVIRECLLVYTILFHSRFF